MRTPPVVMSDAASKTLQDDLDTRTDFLGRCTKCGMELTGSIQFLLSHECENNAREDDEGE